MTYDGARRRPPAAAGSAAATGARGWSCSRAARALSPFLLGGGRERTKPFFTPLVCFDRRCHDSPSRGSAVPCVVARRNSCPGGDPWGVFILLRVAADERKQASARPSSWLLPVVCGRAVTNVSCRQLYRTRSGGGVIARRWTSGEEHLSSSLCRPPTWLRVPSAGVVCAREVCVR